MEKPNAQRGKACALGRRLRQEKYGCATVFDADGDLIGILTEADFVGLFTEGRP